MKSNMPISLLKASPKVLLTSMCLSFVVMFGIQVFYYADVLMGKFSSGFVYAIAVSIGIILQGSRFAFGLAAVWESYHGRYVRMFFGMLLSLALSVVETYEMSHIAHAWELGHHSESFALMLYTVLWVGWALEVRLAVTMGNGASHDSGKNEGIFTHSGTSEPVGDIKREELGKA